METELTKQIKRRIHSFKPQLNTKLRTIRYADEVSTYTGFCDCIRFEDYIKMDNSYCVKIAPKASDLREYVRPEKLDGQCKIEGEVYKNKHCKGCFYQRYRHEYGMLITCYEIKISVSDFKSRNGHNFVGHRNYYVVPIEIAKKVVPLVEEGVGMIAYYPDTGRMKVFKECEHRELDKDVQIELLYAALKKWCDGKQVVEN